MSIMITGGSGFVGLNITSVLLARGETVVLFGPTPPPPAAAAHLARLPGRLVTVSGDVCARATVVDALTTQIQMSYALTAQLRQLSLVNFL